jgi:sulfate/thiosulfate transport system ATP-binding protein
VTPAIVVENLTKRFGTFEAVKDVSFGAEEGQITALLGPSGSGKSTVLRVIAGLESATEGRLWLANEEQTNRRVQERRVGFVFQHYALFRHMTVRENVAFGLSVRKVGKEQQKKRVDELLELVQLGAFGNRYPNQLSGGQRQRVALARALAPRPSVLLLDEPFGALDARVRQDLRRWLDELHRELGVTSMLVTHDQEEALELANHVVVMNEGRIEQVGTPDDIYNRPATPFIAGFVGAAHIVRGIVIGGRLQFGEELLSGAEHLADGTAAHAFVRPQDVRISADRKGPLSCEARIYRISDLGWVYKVHLRFPDGQILPAQVPRGELPGIATGDSVYVDLGAAKVFTAGPASPAPSDELAPV